jgi:hypothetical protein
MIQDVLREAAKADLWKTRIRATLGEDAEPLILEVERKAVYQGGTIGDRLAEAYATAIEAGLGSPAAERATATKPPATVLAIPSESRSRSGVTAGEGRP